MINKNGQINKVFIYIFSVIVVVFAGFLVIKFTGSFIDSSEEVMEHKFFNELEKNYYSIAKTYGSKKNFDFKVRSDIVLVCFIDKLSCIDNLDVIESESKNGDKEVLKEIFNSGQNVVLYDKDDVLIKDKIPEFEIQEGCFCIKPKMGTFNIVFENIKNVVWLKLP